MEEDKMRTLGINQGKFGYLWINRSEVGSAFESTLRNDFFISDQSRLISEGIWKGPLGVTKQQQYAAVWKLLFL